MSQSITSVTLVVRDYDDAIAFFTNSLGFVIIEDTPMPNGKRFVRIAPPGGTGPSLLLARAANSEQAARVGDQTGGRVAFFLHTDDLRRDYNNLRTRGVRFIEEPREELYGTVVVFLDLYGNKWDLVQPRSG
jgi:catechol 2,3-dioxygenase-like lactoylglutathione lyase family enzyme